MFSLIGPPVLWETLVFGAGDDGPWGQYMERYTSGDDARSGHERIAQAIKDGKTPDDLS